MGRPKAMLPFGPETMLARVVRILREVADPVVVVAAPGQELPELPPEVAVLRDRRPNRGPLEGLAVGLAAMSQRTDRVFFTACDLPLLLGEFVCRMATLSVGHDVAVPCIDRFDEPLAAVYHVDVLPHVESLLAADRLRPKALFERVRTRRVTADELSDVDPHLQSLRNTNTPDDYRAALASAGFEPPPSGDDPV